MSASEEKTILILDYDGTLHDSRAVYEPAFRRVMREITDLGWIPPAEYTSAEICYWVGFSATEMWEKFHPELSEAQRREAGGRIGDYMLADVAAGRGRLYAGVPEVLTSLKEQYELLIFSNCDRRYADVHTKAFGLDRWVSGFFCTGEYGYRPKEEVFANYIREPGRRYIAVGDRMKDMTLASACGLQSVGCLYGFGTKEELASADMLIRDIRELEAAADTLRIALTRSF